MKQPKLKACRTVEALIEQLKTLPPSMPLIDRIRPIVTLDLNAGRNKLRLEEEWE